MFMHGDNKFIVFVKMEQTVLVLQAESRGDATCMNPAEAKSSQCPSSPIETIDE